MSVSYEDFPNICRFCLHNGDLQHFTPLKIWNLFKMITNIEVTETDILPKNVCKVCINRLEDISLFIDRCRDNDALLKKIYEENMVKIEIDNDSDNNYDIDQVEGIFIKSEVENKESTSFTITKNTLTLHKDTPHECPKCLKKFSFAEQLRRHVLTHEGVKPFICNICKKGYSRKRALDEHMNFHTGTIPYICSYCGKGFMRHSEQVCHVYRNHNTDIERIPKDKRKYTEKRVGLNLECKICGKIFTSRYGFANHQLIHKGEKKYLCNICGSKFIAKAPLEQHIRIHTGERPFECKECGKKFRLRNSLNLHMSNHVSDKSLNCPHCDKRCYSKNSLTTHISTHSRDKFTCPDCNKQFLHKHTFHNHILNRKCEISYKCNVCEKTFACQTHLDEHVRTHTGEKPFQCSICGKRLSHQRTLKAHMRLHTGETPYVCSVCEKGYHDASGLRKHFNRHHVSDTKLEKTILMTNDDTSKSPVI